MSIPTSSVEPVGDPRAELYRLQALQIQQQMKDAADAKVLSKGQLKSARIDATAKTTLVGAELALKQHLINQRSSALRKQAKALDRPILTDKALAQMASIEDSAMRQARAQAHRGTGGAGIDDERMRAARDLALRKGAQVLSATQAGELSKRAQVADVIKKGTQDLVALKADRNAGLVKGVKSLITDKDVVKAFGKAGVQERDTQATDIRVDTHGTDDNPSLEDQLLASSNKTKPKPKPKGMG